MGEDPIGCAMCGLARLIRYAKLGETVSRPATGYHASTERSRSHHASSVRHWENRRICHRYPPKGVIISSVTLLASQMS